MIQVAVVITVHCDYCGTLLGHTRPVQHEFNPNDVHDITPEAPDYATVLTGHVWSAVAEIHTPTTLALAARGFRGSCSTTGAAIPCTAELEAMAAVTTGDTP